MGRPGAGPRPGPTSVPESQCRAIRVCGLASARRARRGKAETSGGRVRFIQNVEVMVEVVERLRQTERVLGHHGGLFAGDRLGRRPFPVGRQAGSIPKSRAPSARQKSAKRLCAKSLAKLLRAEYPGALPELAENIPRAHDAVLQVRSRLTFEGQGFLEVKSNDDAARKLQQEIAQRGDGDLARVLAIVRLDPAAMSRELTSSAALSDQSIDQVVGFDALAFAPGNLHVGPLARSSSLKRFPSPPRKRAVSPTTS